MGRIKRISFLVTAALMFFCLLLSSTDLIIKEDMAAVKKVSVYMVPVDSPYFTDMKKGILDTAIENRVDVDYVTTGRETDDFAQLKSEYESGSQAVILISDNPDKVRRYISENSKDGPVITVNAFGSSAPGVPDISFDIKGAAAELADTVQKEHGTEVKTILLTGEYEISEEVSRNLKKEFDERGMETVCLNNIDKKPLQCSKEEGNVVFIACSVLETERAAEYLEQKPLYGIGYSNQILRGIQEGRITGVEAFSVYSVGIYAMQQAIAVIEKNKVEDIVLPCKMITKENMEEEEEFLIPIH